MIKIATIIGARPQFIKAGALSRAIRNNFREDIREIIIHTGQHYDENMSGSFFRDLEIPEPEMNLGIAENSHGKQTGMMVRKLEQSLLEISPDIVVLYGDTNSTLAGALAASKINIPVAHIEAGLRSYNKKMPEEINRIVCDQVSTYLFTPTEKGAANLVREGIALNNNPPFDIDNPAIFICGDIMIDNLVFLDEKGLPGHGIMDREKLVPGEYILATIHRDFNTDDPERLMSIFSAFATISEEYGEKIIIPLHPRTKKMMEKLPGQLLDRLKSDRIRIMAPLPYPQMIFLEKHSRMIFTDSGGLQKEAHYFRKPLIILRPETEWEEITEAGAGQLADADAEKIVDAYKYYDEHDLPVFVPFYGQGRTAHFICNKLIEHGNKG